MRDHIQIIGKIYSNGQMTCWKIIQKAGPNVFAAFIQIGNIVYPSKKLICWSSKLYVFLFSSDRQQNATNLQIFKKNESAPEKLSPTRESL